MKGTETEARHLQSKEKVSGSEGERQFCREASLQMSLGLDVQRLPLSVREHALTVSLSLFRGTQFVRICSDNTGEINT